MFLASSRTLEEIRKAKDEGNLPQALLFAGPRNSGRLTSALDLAFSLSGNRAGRRTLSSDNIVFLPERNFALPLRSAYALLAEHPSDRYKYFFIEIVRSVMLQYHPALQKDGHDSKDKFFETAGQIDEMLNELQDMDIEDRGFGDLSSSIMDLASRDDFMFKGKKRGGITVDDIRAVQNYVSVGENLKFIILENIESSTEATRNALLKVLEEPPAGAYFILISDNPQRILQTILSRVRKFTFLPPSKEHLNECLRERFLTYRNYSDMDEFFYETMLSEAERAELEKIAGTYLESLITGKLPDVRDENQMFTTIEKDKGLDYFMSLVEKGIEKAFREGRIPAFEAKRRMKLLSDITVNREVYNQNARTGLDLALREV